MWIVVLASRATGAPLPLALVHAGAVCGALGAAMPKRSTVLTVVGAR